MPEITLEQLKQYRRRIVAVDAPEIAAGGQLFVTEMSALDQLEFFDRYGAKAGQENDLSRPEQLEMMNALLDRTLCTADGMPLFANGAGAADLVLPLGVHQRLWQAAVDLNGMRADAQASAEKNSRRRRRNSSPTA